MGGEVAGMPVVACAGLPLKELGEELPGGRVRCGKCGKWCASWLGLAVHFGKAHGKRGSSRCGPSGAEGGREAAGP